MSGKSRSFLGVLYPDSESYDCSAVLERLSCLFEEWAYILHDSDSDENGELKKAHIHWVGRLENATSLLAIADSLLIYLCRFAVRAPYFAFSRHRALPTSLL